MPQITRNDEPLLQEWLNCTAVSVDADGDVWVEGPMVGHWLSADRKAEFATWRQARA